MADADSRIATLEAAVLELDARTRRPDGYYVVPAHSPNAPQPFGPLLRAADLEQALDEVFLKVVGTRSPPPQGDLRRISATQREAILGFYREGKRVGRIAAATGVSRQSVTRIAKEAGCSRPRKP